MNFFEKNLKHDLANFVRADVEASEYQNNMRVEDIEHQLLRQPAYNINRSLFLLIDIFNPKTLNDIFSKMSSKSVAIVWYRDINQLIFMMNHYDFTSHDCAMFLYAGNVISEADSAQFYKLTEGLLVSLTNIQPILRETEDLAYIKDCSHIIKTLREFRDNMRFVIGNDLDDTLYGIRNRLINIHRFIQNPGIRDFKEKFGRFYKDKPAVIIASGPSLDKNIKVLKKHQSNALVLCCDGSISACRNNAIVPDIIGSVERVSLTYKLFYENKLFDSNSVFMSPAVVRPEMVNTFSEKFVTFFKKGEGFGDWLNEATNKIKGTIKSGTSVAHMMMNIADYLECNPIILIGQDLAYSKKGNSHASDAEIREAFDETNVETYVKDYEGNDLASTMIWKRFLITFEQMIAEKSATVIDSTEGGAFIKGTTVMPLEESLGKFADFTKPNLRELVDQLEVTADEQLSQSTNYLRHVLGYYDDCTKLLEKVKLARKMNRKSANIIDKGITTQSQLDKIYDSLEFVDNDVVKYIIQNSLLAIYFQYPIYTAIQTINRIKETQYTEENIATNVMIHRDLLDTIGLYAKKMLRCLYEGLVYAKEHANLDVKLNDERFKDIKMYLNDDALTFRMQ